MTSGAVQFARYALPPNAYGYCGPADTHVVADLLDAREDAASDLARVAREFAGAWPYLAFLGESSGSNPLASHVVEAYWLGNGLLANIDMLAWGNSVDDRFRRRSGSQWQVLAEGIVGSVPNHAFHVFCVYPWVGLLRSGATEQAMRVIDQCRIRWGTVIDVIGEEALVESRPLAWDGHSIHPGSTRVETVRTPNDQSDITAGDVVSMHWDYICETLTPEQLRNLIRYHDRHLSIANQGSGVLAGVIER